MKQSQALDGQRSPTQATTIISHSRGEQHKKKQAPVHHTVALIGSGSVLGNTLTVASISTYSCLNYTYQPLVAVSVRGLCCKIQ